MLPGRAYQLEDFLRIAWRRKWVIALPFVVVSVATVLFSRSLPDQFSSETLILVVPQRVPESYVRSTVTDRIEDRLKSLQQQILSRSRLEPIIVDLNLYPELRSTMAMEDVVTQMRASIKVATVRGDAFSVSYVSLHPQIAQLVTTRLASAFVEENVRERGLLADGTSQFLQVQLDEARRQLVEQEQKLEHYRLQHAGEMPSQAAANLQALQNARLQLQALADSMNRHRDRQLVLERQLADLLAPDVLAAVTFAAPPGRAPAAAATELSPGTPAEQLQEARLKLRALEDRRLTAQHPDVSRLQRQIRSLEHKVASGSQDGTGGGQETAAPMRSASDILRERRVREVRDELHTVARRIQLEQTKEQQLNDEIAAYQARLEAAPVRESELTELTRDYETLQEIYRTLLAKREDSKIAANLERRQVGEQFKVLDPARVPERPFSPNRQKINLAGIALGLLLGFGLAALLEYADATLKTEDDVRQVLALPVLAVVPMMRPGRGAQPRRPQRRWPFAAAVAVVVRVWPW